MHASAVLQRCLAGALTPMHAQKCTLTPVFDRQKSVKRAAQRRQGTKHGVVPMTGRYYRMPAGRATLARMVRHSDPFLPFLLYNYGSWSEWTFLKSVL